MNYLKQMYNIMTELTKKLNKLIKIIIFGNDEIHTVNNLYGPALLV
ncbi:hypothetical protein SAMN05421594_4132 [Chryseobacterium oleae]|uniref:Uncharacterized protein n=1 Tax=Chryseobacterium oleae TaxID=491207 RepID=A0A1I5BS46_CHROL|nr:hypothetical protein SAMN05421594_4132 [Chryseobacterium oleae]